MHTRHDSLAKATLNNIISKFPETGMSAKAKNTLRVLDEREKLEEYLYSGAIRTDEELVNVAGEMGITLKISDDAEKVRSIDDVVVGEVRFKTPFETKRKRIYGTTNGYTIVELLG